MTFFLHSRETTASLPLTSRAFLGTTMKISKALILVAIALSSIVSSSAQEDGKSSVEEDYTGSVLRSLHPDEIVQVMIMHRNGEGKAEAEKAASRVIGEIPRFNIVVATMSVHDVEGLRYSPDIEGVDLDKAVKVAPKPLEEFDDHDLIRR